MGLGSFRFELDNEGEERRRLHSVIWMDVYSFYPNFFM